VSPTEKARMAITVRACLAAMSSGNSRMRSWHKLRVRLVLDLAQRGAVGQSAGARVAAPESASGLQGFEASAYRFSIWLYRPWGGRSPPLRARVAGNAKQAAKRGIGRCGNSTCSVP